MFILVRELCFPTELAPQCPNFHFLSGRDWANPLKYMHEIWKFMRSYGRTWFWDQNLIQNPDFLVLDLVNLFIVVMKIIVSQSDRKAPEKYELPTFITVYTSQQGRTTRKVLYHQLQNYMPYEYRFSDIIFFILKRLVWLYEGFRLFVITSPGNSRTL